MFIQHVPFIYCNITVNYCEGSYFAPSLLKDMRLKNETQKNPNNQLHKARFPQIKSHIFTKKNPKKTYYDIENNGCFRIMKDGGAHGSC